MATDGDDLDLLLSLREERVLETPPDSPSSLRPQPPVPGYGSDDGSPRRVPSQAADMSVFRDAVKDYLEAEPSTTYTAHSKPSKARRADEVEVEKFSGLRIRNSLASSVELANRFSDIRFVRISALRNLLVGDTLAGCWATVGVLAEKGAAKLSSSGKNYCVWKMGSLDETNVSVFLFGDAYTRNLKEPAGTVFALFNATVRKDAVGNGFSLSVYSAGQILKMGTSADYGVCKGKRKDGMACTMAINKRQGMYCRYHSSNASQKYETMRSELKGGNIGRAFRLQSEGIYMVKPFEDRSNLLKPVQKVKVMSVDGLKKALSNADKVTTNSQSQGIRFLTQVTASVESKFPSKRSHNLNQTKGGSEKRSYGAMKMALKIATRNEQPEAKRQKSCHASKNMIELDIVSSDEEG